MDATISVVVTVPATLTVGQTTQAVARIVTDVSDSALDTKSVVWSSSAPLVASVDANGSVKGVAAGVASIKAAVGTVSGSASVSVAVPVIDITQAQEDALKLIPLNGTGVLRGPGTEFVVVVTGI